jgi:hypothetical protein
VHAAAIAIIFIIINGVAASGFDSVVCRLLAALEGPLPFAGMYRKSAWKSNAYIVDAQVATRRI